MDRQRAVEVVDSLGVIEVLHKGLPVWIEEVDGDIARVKYLKTQQHAQVPVEELVEDTSQM